jgi:carbonic anhydrase
LHGRASLGARQSPVCLPAAEHLATLDSGPENQAENGGLTPIISVSSPEHSDKAIVNNTGQTVRVDWVKGASLRVRDRVHELLQFHFHWPAEHVVAGRRSPLEMHFVFNDAREALPRTAQKARLAVLGVVFELGEASPFMDQILDAVPDDVGASTKPVNLELLDLERMYEQQLYSLNGSLTTAPFSEGVSWFVSAQPLTVSCCQLDKLVKANLMKCNHRAVQPLGDREVVAGVLQSL